MKSRLQAPALAVGLLLSLILSPVSASNSALPSDAASPVSQAPRAASPSLKLRSDLAALVAGELQLDPRVPNLVSGYRPGEIPYFAVLSEPNDAIHRSAVEALGARVLRSYRTTQAFALASDATSVLRIASLPWVEWLAPVEVVVALNEPIADQSRSTTADVGAPNQWEAGITGQGVRVAVLDTGLDRSHPDLDDLDFRQWSGLLHDAKVVDARDFNGGGCGPMLTDGHGHGTHVAGIATGTGEGTPGSDDDGRYTGVAPDAELAIAKVLTDAGAGLNSDLVAAMEWAALPEDSSPAGCAIGADIVNMSIGSEARPTRLNSDSDVDFVSFVLNRLAVRYGTLFVAAAGNSGPYIGSVLEAPGSAAQALSVAATAKDYDLNHDDTLSGDTCAGYQHPPSSSPSDNDCSAGVGTQSPSISSFSSRGPSGGAWLRPDVSAPGYNIVSAQAATGAAIANNDLNIGTRADPLYATATGTSMATPAAAGSAALLLQAYREAYGTDPSGGSGVAGLQAPAHALLRAALMNSAGGDLREARWILTTDAGTRFECPDPDPLFGLCGIVEIFTNLASGSLTLYEVRNRAADPYVGPLAEGAGKLNVPRAIAALRDGVLVYSSASGTGSDAGMGQRDLQGSWQIGPARAGTASTQSFVVHAAPGAGPVSVEFSFSSGNPSDGSQAIPADWVATPAAVSLDAAGEALVDFSISIPSTAPAGPYTGVVLATTTAGQRIRIPVLAAVSLHDPDVAEANPPGPQARLASEADVFAKDDTSWPSAVGTPGTGSNADWLVYPVELAGDLSEARFSIHDATAGDETYDLYLYDSRLDLIASTHPFAAPGVTDPVANDARGPSTVAAPQVLSLPTPAAGQHYLAISRARIGGTTSGDFGAFVLTLDEIRRSGPPAPTELSYEGDFLFTQGTAGRLAARLTDAAGGPIAGREVTFTFDAGVAPCPGGACAAITDSTGLAQVATDPIALDAGVHEAHAAFTGGAHWEPSGDDAFVMVVASDLPPLPGGGARLTAGGWFVPDPIATGVGNDGRVYFAFHAESNAANLPAGGQLRVRDGDAGIDVRLVGYTTMTVTGDTVTLTGTVQHADGDVSSFSLRATDNREPGRGHDTIDFRLIGDGYEASGTLGGGNVQLHGD